MEAILDELKQYDLKRINDIENISFKNDYTLHNKYYVSVNFHNNIVVSLYVCKRLFKNDVYKILQSYNDTHLYEIEHNFEIQNIIDIFYIFCLNNYANQMLQINQLIMYLQTTFSINPSKCEISLFSDNYDRIHCLNSITVKKITISNLNELNLYYNAKNEHSTIINVIFEKN
jgi:hypothetical protein